MLSHLHQHHCGGATARDRLVTGLLPKKLLAYQRLVLVSGSLGIAALAWLIERALDLKLLPL